MGSPGYGALWPRGLKPCKGGDMACVRGPLGACVATCHNEINGGGPLLYQGRSLLVSVEMHRERLITLKNV